MAKYTCDFKHKIYFNVYIYIYIYIYQNLAKQFTLYSAEAYSEPFPTSLPPVSLEVTIFTKNSILDIWKGSEYVVA